MSFDKSDCVNVDKYCLRTLASSIVTLLVLDINLLPTSSGVKLSTISSLSSSGVVNTM